MGDFVDILLSFSAYICDAMGTTDSFREDLMDLLLSGHNKQLRDEIALRIGGNPDHFEQAWEIFCHAEQPVPQRLAWSLGVVMEKHPSLVVRYAGSIIDRIPFMQHPAEIRMATKVLGNTSLKPDEYARLIDPMLERLMDPKVPAAIRVHAMQILYEFSETEPDFKFELRLVIEEQLAEGGPAIKSRGKKLLKKLNEQIRKLEMG